MKLSTLVIFVLFGLSPLQALGYIIDYTGTMEMSRTPWGDPDPLSLEKFDVPFEVEADTETLNFLTMSIWLDGIKLTHHVENTGHIARWDYYLNQWNAVDGFYWRFEHNGVNYDLEWLWVEIPSPPGSNPIEEFHSFAEGPWYFGVYDSDYSTSYSAWPKGPIHGLARQIPEPATFILLSLGLLITAIQRLVRNSRGGPH
ncbi:MULTISPECIES: PEP-CTERM sorting domain-containing protein [unclassified Marinobacter]|uniref:PEP-CTERM sorting domain-containing protein n=1 Tax=unclassified Marinobacter TaxID=83889 RepID=UPI001268410E|nr:MULTISPECIES: PEP-CTERM sorting domain-containing protein [unclassified Marinobacter]QFS86940.1 hypothetical protein FIV08_08860 [Marinobacter sp. THAF197a]QFT50724.1 hypothetical protein FIU96_08790 [Marinobacter sp. THAF39]